jgi:hypothetical protein
VHYCWRKVFDALQGLEEEVTRNANRIPLTLKLVDGALHVCPIALGFCADHPEQQLLAGVSPAWNARSFCRFCKIVRWTAKDHGDDAEDNVSGLEEELCSDNEDEMAVKARPKRKCATPRLAQPGIYVSAADMPAWTSCVRDAIYAFFLMPGVVLASHSYHHYCL